MRKLISLEDAIDRYDAELDEYIQDCAWSDGFSEDKASDMLDALCKEDGFKIDWENAPSKLLWSVWVSTEKGLS